ncbi:MAG: hypothetical protein RTU92_07705 [Candidatus Thorarchaeota archaeon]
MIVKLKDIVLPKISPTDIEIQNQKTVILKIKEALSTYAELHGFEFSFIEAQGSTGSKQTQLRDTADIDLFVALNPEDYPVDKTLTTRRTHSDLLFDRFVQEWFLPTALALNAKNPQKTYSQHPYLSMIYQGFEVDILGCYDIPADVLAEDGPITAVDRTIHHSRYVSDKISDEQRDDVRVLKSFVRASHSYGDRCAVGRTGFTGYSLELLVLSSNDLFDAISKLLQLEVTPLDPKGRSRDILKLDSAFRDDYVFMIDPTDYSRNVASSFDSRAYKWVSLRYKHFLDLLEKDQTIEAASMVIEKPIPVDPVPEWFKKHVFTVEFVSDGSIHYTVLRDKIHKLAGKLRQVLEREPTGEERFGKIITEVVFEDSRFSMGIVTEHESISESFYQRGPPVHLTDAVEQFREAHQKVHEKDGFLWVERKRVSDSAVDYIQPLLKENPIKGIEITKAGATTSIVLNVLFRYVLPVENEFLPEEWEQFKDERIDFME